MFGFTRALRATTILAGLLAVPCMSLNASPWPTEAWPEADPESQGLSSAPLNRFISRARSGEFRDLHSALLIKNGHLVLEEYFPGGARDQIHTVQSVSKSITSTLVGIAIERGQIRDLSAPLLSFFPQVQPVENLDDRKRAITLEHTLRMRLGMDWHEHTLPYEDPQNSLRQLNTHDGDWYELVLDSPMAEPPGERFLYNSGGAILLAGVLEHATGERADEFARRTLFDPLGIGDTRWTVVHGVTHTGGGLAMSARDMARIGYLYLRDGIWDGVRILPEGWVARATEGPVETAAPGQMPIGYGLMWWLFPGPEDVESREAVSSIYAAWGHMGQFIIVAPEYDLVFVTTGGANDFADEVRPIDCLYDFILPAADPSIPFIDPPPVTAAVAHESPAPSADEDASVATFETTVGGPNSDRGISVIATSDGGFAATGFTTSFGAGQEDVYVVRVDSAGNTTHSTTIGGEGKDHGWAILQTDDAGFVVAGYTDSFGAGGLDAYLIRTDASGDTLWTRTYGGAADDLVWDVHQTDDGGFVLAGQTESRGAGEFDFYLIRTDERGRVLWERTYGGPRIDRAFSIQPAHGGGFVMAGITYSFGAGGRDGWIVKTDADGHEVWTRALGSEGYDVSHSVCTTSDRGYVVVGYSEGLSVHGGQDAYIVKLDADGETVWTSIFGGARDDRTITGCQAPDGGYILTGFTVSSGAGGLDAYLVKLDAHGEPEWTRTFGGRGEDFGYGVTTAPDGGFILTGHSRSTGAGEEDLYLVKTDSGGLR